MTLICQFPPSSPWPILLQSVARLGQNNLLVLEELAALVSSPHDSSGFFPCRRLVSQFLRVSQCCAGLGDFPLWNKMDRLLQSIYLILSWEGELNGVCIAIENSPNYPLRFHIRLCIHNGKRFLLVFPFKERILERKRKSLYFIIYGNDLKKNCNQLPSVVHKSFVCLVNFCFGQKMFPKFWFFLIQCWQENMI